MYEPKLNKVHWEGISYGVQCNCRTPYCCPFPEREIDIQIKVRWPSADGLHKNGAPQKGRKVVESFPDGQREECITLLFKISKKARKLNLEKEKNISAAGTSTQKKKMNEKQLCECSARGILSILTALHSLMINLFNDSKIMDIDFLIVRLRLPKCIDHSKMNEL
uniref:Uncharacterized protein n=1 Tax=Romanomermis culicivorax TaxID=13658 RepID=A0A915KAE0_ROMCU